MKIGLIGFGGMARVVVSTLQKSQAEFDILGAVIPAEEIAQVNKPALALFDELDDLIRLQPDIIVECAAHAAVREYGERILTAGIRLVVISIGALADAALFERLRAAAAKADTSLLLPAGAIGGMDALSAARFSGLHSVCYRARKPALAWSGTPAEERLDLAALNQAECFYQGSAREAALLYPKNSNVAATVAIAGLGFDKTRVELIADPALTENCHEIIADANAGSFQIQLSGYPLPDSPKTSALAAYSVVKCVSDQVATVII